MISSRWLRGLVAGTCGTATMATTTWLESAVLHRERPVDYDDSFVMVRLVERVVPVDPSELTERVVNQLMRFGYGSFAGLLLVAFDKRLNRPEVAVFASTWAVEVIALSAFGAAPPPWRWKRDVLVSSLVQHGVYAVATGAVYRELTPQPIRA